MREGPLPLLLRLELGLLLLHRRLRRLALQPVVLRDDCDLLLLRALPRLALRLLPCDARLVLPPRGRSAAEESRVKMWEAEATYNSPEEQAKRLAQRDADMQRARQAEAEAAKAREG